jgi:mono/diheme cytochrome c family protein
MSNATKKTWAQVIRWKLVAAVIAGVALWVISGALGFPRIFQWMYVSYAFLGFLVFVLLDAPGGEPLTGWKAILGIVIFYLICSAVLVTAGTLLPQFDPRLEMAGITRKTDKYRLDAAQTASLMEKTKELSAQAQELIAKLNQLQATGAHLGTIEASAPAPSAGSSSANLAGMDPVERGKLVFKDYECYNCHKVGGRGGKKRGPELDNIGNLATEAQLKDKIFHPNHWHAEGFEDRQKDKMPEKFADLMSDVELNTLVAYLQTLKNPEVKTPHPIFPPGYSIK